MYLIDTGDFAITVDDIKKAIGLETDTFDALIDNGIASICSQAPRPVRHEVWMVEPNRVFGAPAKAGPEYTYAGKVYRNYTYEADPTIVEIARRKVLRWCEDQDDLMRALADQNRRVPTSAKAVLGLVAASMPEAV
jgi:hypothetical protein